MRVTATKSKNAESFYINYAFIDKNGKSTSHIYKKLGTLKELSEKLHADRDVVMAWVCLWMQMDSLLPSIFIQAIETSSLH